MSYSQFESRKKDHIKWALSEKTQGRLNIDKFSRISLIHEALPEIDFSEVDISTKIFNIKFNSPMFVSSMTGGHDQSGLINSVIAEACSSRNWLMGVGSQRRELDDKNARNEWVELRKKFPKLQLMANLGISQLITATDSQIYSLIEATNAAAFIVHLNPLQECFQPEGTPVFKGALKAIEKLCLKLDIPVIVKETGCGFSSKTMSRLNNTGISVLDIAGKGGTHWGLVEAYRSDPESIFFKSGLNFGDWGESTIEAMSSSLELELNYDIWASGGLRSGLDAAKLISMGASAAGFAMPIMVEALKGVDSLIKLFDQYEYELKVALFCTGSQNIEKFQEKKAWLLR